MVARLGLGPAMGRRESVAEAVRGPVAEGQRGQLVLVARAGEVSPACLFIYM